jgi:hypothetical protein
MSSHQEHAARQHTLRSYYRTLSRIVELKFGA